MFGWKTVAVSVLPVLFALYLMFGARTVADFNQRPDNMDLKTRSGRFNAWFWAHGGRAPQVDVRESPGGQGYGLFAKSTIKAGATWLYVPPKIFLSKRTIAEQPCGKVILKALAAAGQQVEDKELMALYLLADMRNRKSFFEPWLSLMPRPSTFESIHLNYTTAERELMSGALGRTVNYFDDKNRAFHRDVIMAKLVPLDSVCFTRESSRLELWQWTKALVDSRAFDEMHDGKAMIPMLDMVNYDPEGPPFHSYQRAANVTFREISNVEVPAGTEMLKRYSSMGGIELMVEYGFLPESDSWMEQDTVVMSLLRGDDDAAEKRRFVLLPHGVLPDGIVDFFGSGAAAADAIEARMALDFPSGSLEEDVARLALGADEPLPANVSWPHLRSILRVHISQRQIVADTLAALRAL